MPSGDSSKVVASRGIRVYVKDWASAPTIPTDPYDTTPAGWDYKGYTIGGLHASFQLDFADIRVDQEIDRVFAVATGRDLRMTTALGEIDVANLRDAAGMGTIDTVDPDYDELEIGSDITENFRSVFFRVLNPGDGAPFDLFGPKCQSVGSVVLDFTPEAASQIAFEQQVLPDTSLTPTLVMAIRDYNNPIT